MASEYLERMKNLKWLASLFFAPLLMAVTAGQKAPDFSAKNQDGKTVHLADQKGKFVLLFFYPKDETPGCTAEVCSFRDNFGKIKELNAVLFGVSRQDEKSHQKFIAKHKLPFDLLVDADGSLGKTYGVGSIPILGFSKRQSVLIGPDGKVVKFYESVDPATHTQEVIADIQAAKKP